MNEQMNSTPELEPKAAFPLDGEETAVDVEVGEVEVGEVEVGEVEAGEVEAGEVEAGEVEAGEAADVEGGEEGGEEGDGFSAPEEYVERDKGERRRVGSDVKVDDITFKNVPLLSRFLDRRGRIMSRRKTRVSAKMQRRIVREVKRARHLALLPYTADQTRQVRRRR